MRSCSTMASSKRLATLVGCNYPNTRNELRGCINDVHAMHHLLTTRFNFNPSDITILTDDTTTNSSLLPTGANILQTLTLMADQSAPGDVLFFHYSGHGTLIPHHAPRRSSSKRDEAIVPCDFNLITDVDFRRLVDRLPSGVSFTIVSDSCHSGGLIDKEKEQIGPSEKDKTLYDHRTRTIPYQSVLEHLSSLSGIESGHIGDHLVEVFGEHASAKYNSLRETGKGVIGPDDGILLSGCGTDETSADMSPEEEDGVAAAAYGAFSNSIQMVMKEVVKGRVISNRELVMRAREMLREQGFVQHPCLYCSDENADEPFLKLEEEEEVVKDGITASVMWDYARPRKHFSQEALFPEALMPKST